tara:strand:- start:3043 stop:3276 length:234 start_codon:yes stop_codon:yes gene_type:complete
MNACIEHHSKELYIERKEQRFERTRIGYTDSPERKKKRRKKFKQEFLRAVESERKYMKRNSSDKDIVENYKKITAAM